MKLTKGHSKTKIIKRIFLYMFIILFAGISAVLINSYIVSAYSGEYIYNSIDSIPLNRVGLVPGTVRDLVGGGKNPYFFYRINAAVKLFKAGKIKFILVSGDNSVENYNEPRMMKNELVKKGIPENKIFLDYAGFDTFDSMIRCQKVFGLDSVTVISQKFHNERAVFIGRNRGIIAIAFNSNDVGGIFGLKNKLREYLARVKMFMDLFVWNAQPKYLGEKIEIK